MGVARAPEEPDSLAAEAIPGRSAGAGGVQPWGTVCSSFCFQVRNDNGFQASEPLVTDVWVRSDWSNRERLQE